MATSAASSFWAKRFPTAHARYIQFQGTSAYKAGAWTWKKKRYVALAASVTWIGAAYYKVSLEETKRDTILPNTYLVWKFHPGSIVETRGKPSLAALLSSSSGGEEPARVLTLFDAVHAIENAANDPRIRGIYGDFSTLSWPNAGEGEPLGLAQIEELSAALHRFNRAKKIQFAEQTESSDTAQLDQANDQATDADKAVTQAQRAQDIPPTIAFADTFMSQSTYLLASAFDKVYVQSTGAVPLTGVSTSVPFFARLLDKLGIKINASARREYKSMISSAVQEQGLTKPQAENQAQLLGELNKNVAYAIGIARFPNEDPEKAADKVMAIMQNGPYSAQEARELGLIDGIGYSADVGRMIHAGRDVLAEATAKSLLGPADDDSAQEADPGKVHLKTFPHYSSILQKYLQTLGKDHVVDVAVCYLRGTISSAVGESSASAVIKGLRQAARDDKIKAIVLRIDSGGGDVVASESVWHAVRRVREATNKRVIVSFGNVAASGSYYLATAADVILASDSTITGSIGVASIRPTLTRKLFDYAGVAIQSFFTGAKGDALLYEASEEQKSRNEHHIDEIYADFLQKVMDGRQISKEVIEDVAGGRVFTGLSAISLGFDNADPQLVDAIMRSRTDLLKLAQRPTRHIVTLTEQALGIASSDIAFSSLKGDVSLADPSRWRSQQNLGALGAGNPAHIAQWQLQEFSEPHELDARRIVLGARLAQEGAAGSDSPRAESKASSPIENVADAVRSGADLVSDAANRVAAEGASSAQAAHQAAVKSRADEPTSLAEKNAERAAVAVPFGRSLIDAIGGTWEAAVLAADYTIQKEFAELMLREKCTEEEARLRHRAKARPANATNDQPAEVGVRLVRFPKPKSYKEILQDLNTSGYPPKASTALAGLWSAVREEMSIVLSQALVKAITLVASDPAGTLMSLHQRIEASRAESGATQTKMEYQGWTRL